MVHFNRGVKSPRYFGEKRKRDIIVDVARRKKISRCSFEGEIFCGHLLTSLDFGKDYGIKKLSPLKVSKLAAHFDLIREGSFKCVGNPACVNGDIKSLIRAPSPPIFLFSSFSSFSFATPSGKKNKLSPSISILPSCPKGGARKGRKEGGGGSKDFVTPHFPPSLTHPKTSSSSSFSNTSSVYTSSQTREIGLLLSSRFRQGV